MMGKTPTHSLLRSVSALGLAAALTLTACGTGETGNGGATTPGGEPVTLEFWGWVPGLEDAVATWNEANPNIQIDFFRMTGDDGDLIPAAIDAGTAPDIVQMSAHSLPGHIVNNRLVDLSEYVPGLEAEFTESSWGTISFGDARYAIPQDSGPTGLMYRTDIFDEYGLTVPTTWDEYVETARELQAADAQHRHLSQLYPWFPGDSGPDGDAGAVARTLDVRGDDSTGWSLVWKLALAARLRDTARIERLLPLVLRPADDSSAHRGGLYPNLFAAHPPFQIDANLGFVGAVAEMLLQSHRPGLIELLPALPRALRAGHASGLIARPGIVVDLAWSAGVLERVELTARRPEAAGVRDIIAGSHRVTVEVPHGTALVLDGSLREIHHRQEHS